MKSVSKLAMMAAGLAVAVAAVVVLRNRLETGSPASPDLLAIESKSASEQGQPASTPKVSHQPRILQAKPFVRHENASPPYREMKAESLKTTAAKIPLQPSPAQSGVSWPNSISPDFNGTAQPPSDPQAPNPLAEGLLESAIQLPTGPSGGWPAEQPPATETWTTQENDSLWDISVARYGTGGFYHALFVQNRTRIHRPDRIEGGVLLETPSASILRERFPELCPPTSTRVTRASAERNSETMRR